MHELKSEDAAVSGEAARIPAAMKAQQAVLAATIQITRAATGKVEEYTLTGTVPAEKED